METSNTESGLVDLIGKFKVVTVILGIIDVGLIAGSFNKDNNGEEYFLAISCVACLLSLLFVILILASIIPITEVWKRLDMIFHGIITLLLGLGVVLQLIAITEDRKLSGRKIAERVFALVFGALNTGIYGFIGFAIYRTPSVN